MRGRSTRPAEEADVDLTPMLDVVFILLIFFIVTSTFIQEKALGLEPPPPPSPSTPEQQVPAIVVYVSQDNLIRVNGRLTDLGGVRANIERLKAENPESALVIQAHPDARSGTIIKIRDEAYNAQMDRVNVIQSQS
jgi:biopolymer transport protein ExbD